MSKIELYTLGNSKSEKILCELLNLESARTRNKALNLLEEQNRKNKALNTLGYSDMWESIIILINSELLKSAQNLKLNKRTESFLLNVMKARRRNLIKNHHEK